MAPDVVKQYLALCALDWCYNIDADGVDSVPVQRMRWILKKLILRGCTINCALCGRPITKERDLTLDHTVPHSRGGSDYLHNMQPAHRKCNELKGNTMTDADVAESCANSDDSAQKIAARYKQRKDAYKKHRNAKWLKPWQIDDEFYCGR